jgi:hypothetical protein
MTRRFLTTLHFLSLSLLSVATADAQCVTQKYASSSDARIGIHRGSGWSSGSFVAGAIGMWQDCATYGLGFPTLHYNINSDIDITVDHISGFSGGYGCAAFVGYRACSTCPATGGRIEVYDTGLDRNGNVINCQTFGDGWQTAIAHEIGHALTLDHSACDGYLMGRPDMPRWLHSEECAAVDEAWTMPVETKPEPDPGMSECETSPIILSVRGDYQLTSVPDGVEFDIDADGDTDRVSWTAPATDLGFLALDRNGNGRIDNGGELFGDSTYLRNGEKAPNGFKALAELDSNGDAVVDELDGVWLQLLVWKDTDHDGTSSAGELTPIASTRVRGVSTKYQRVGRVDEHGNMFRYQGEIILREGRRKCYDVFFKTMD